MGIWTINRARHELNAVKEAARITVEEKQQEVIGQHTEDGTSPDLHVDLDNKRSLAISVDTLGELARSPNWDVSSSFVSSTSLKTDLMSKYSAVKIADERATKPANLTLLLENVRSRNPETRHRALVVLRHLALSPVLEALCTIETFTTIIELLVSFLPLAESRSPFLDTDWKLRTKAERNALEILVVMLRTRVKDLIAAGLVSRWLAHYPFGGKLPDNSTTRQREKTKQKVVDALKAGQSDDEAMREIVQQLVLIAEGRRQLRRYGLIGSLIEEGEMWNPDGPNGHFDPTDGINTFDGEIIHDFSDGTIPTLTDLVRPSGNVADQATRNRRRHAMVIADDGEPLSAENIFTVNENGN